VDHDDEIDLSTRDWATSLYEVNRSKKITPKKTPKRRVIADSKREDEEGVGDMPEKETGTIKLMSAEEADLAYFKVSTSKVRMAHG
tara:strand:+ start:1728 stop:1985 length:258 start_codon:yes stop_codon:yes gene_type:complete